jgi:hypothetical protein
MEFGVVCDTCLLSSLRFHLGAGADRFEIKKPDWSHDPIEGAAASETRSTAKFCQARERERDKRREKFESD